MFDNIGGKIKVLAVVLTWVGIGASSIVAFAIWIGEGSFFLGLGVLSGGALASWLGSFLLYGFGELIDNTQQIAINTRKTVSTQTTVSTKPSNSTQTNYLAIYKTKPASPAKKETTCPHCCHKITIYEGENNCPLCFLKL